MAAAGCGDDVFDLPVPAAGLALRLICPQDGCGRPASVVVRRLRITLRDDEPPAFAAAPAGGLVGAGPVHGLQTITFTATDRGGGVAAATLLVDGAPRAHVALGCHRPYTRPVPCPLRATGRLRLDT